VRHCETSIDVFSEQVAGGIALETTNRTVNEADGSLALDSPVGTCQVRCSRSTRTFKWMSFVCTID